MEPVRIWDELNQCWLIPVSINFNEDATAPTLVIASRETSEEWQTFSGDELNNITIYGDISKTLNK